MSAHGPPEPRPVVVPMTGRSRAPADPPAPTAPTAPTALAPTAPRGPTQLLPDGLVPVVEAVPGLARVTAYAALHTAGWGVRTSARTGWRVARALRDPEEATALIQDATQVATTMGQLARSATAGTPLDRALQQAGTALGERVRSEPREPREPTAPVPVDLRRRGADLLQRSRDVWDEDSSHPAYERILGELAPDEARVLLLLVQHGPQPSVDVRTGGPIGLVNSRLIAPGLTMIGARAGCRYLDSVPAFLNNLFRLGLVWFSRESLRDPTPYQVLEAQPDVLAAVHSVTFARVVRRSIHLTPFGEDFCRTCLIEQDSAAGALPAHATPPVSESGEPPSHG